MSMRIEDERTERIRLDAIMNLNRAANFSTAINSPQSHFLPSTSTSASTTSSTHYFSPGHRQSQGQGKYVIRLTNLEEENIQLRSKIEILEKWKERMDEWMLDQFGVTLNDAEFDRTVETASAVPAENGSLENGHSERPCSPYSPTTPNIVKVESLSPRKNPGHSGNLNSTANVIGTGQEESDGEDGSDSTVERSESESDTAVPPTQNQNTNTSVSAVIQPRNLFPENCEAVSNHVPSTSSGHSSEHHLEREGAKSPVSMEEEDNAPCDVCGSPEPEWNNSMVFCDGCNVCVHQGCYGISKVPHGVWKCRTCAEGIEPGTQPCLFCPTLGGAMTRCKSPSQKQWAHVSCAWWIPEVTFGNPDRMDTVINIPRIPKSRWSLRCKLCGIKKGACIQCYYKRCQVAFHVTCAHKQGLKMSMCDEDSDGETNDGMDPNSFRMHVYCESHRGCESPTPKRRRTDTSPRREKKKSI